MAEEVKEKLTEQEVETPVVEDTQDSVEDYFNPFADIKEKEEEVVEEVEVKEEAPVKKEQTVDTGASDELKEVKASIQAQRDVAKLVKENPMYADYADQIAEIATKAIVRGHKNPVEFAIRNIKSPEEWIEIGRKSGIEDAGVALKSRVGGASLGRTEGNSLDFNSMSTNDFEKFVNNVKNL